MTPRATGELRTWLHWSTELNTKCYLKPWLARAPSQGTTTHSTGWNKAGSVQSLPASLPLRGHAALWPRMTDPCILARTHPHPSGMWDSPPGWGPEPGLIETLLLFALAVFFPWILKVDFSKLEAGSLITLDSPTSRSKVQDSWTYSGRTGVQHWLGLYCGLLSFFFFNSQKSLFPGHVRII